MCLHWWGQFWNLNSFSLRVRKKKFFFFCLPLFSEPWSPSRFTKSSAFHKGWQKNNFATSLWDTLLTLVAATRGNSFLQILMLVWFIPQFGDPPLKVLCWHQLKLVAWWWHSLALLKYTFPESLEELVDAQDLTVGYLYRSLGLWVNLALKGCSRIWAPTPLTALKSSIINPRPSWEDSPTYLKAEIFLYFSLFPGGCIYVSQCLTLLVSF